MADEAVEKRNTKYDSNAVTVHWIARCLGRTFIYLQLHRLPSDADMKWLNGLPEDWVILVVCGSNVEAKDAVSVLSKHDLEFAVWKGKFFYHVREFTLSESVEPKIAIAKVLEFYDEEVGEISLEFIDGSEAADDGEVGECQPKKEATNGRNRYWEEHPDEWSSICEALKTHGGSNEDLERARPFCSFLRRKKGTSLKDASADEFARLLEEYFEKRKLGRVKQNKLLEVLNGARQMMTNAAG